MITGAHFLLYKDADADRQFLRDVLGFRGVDAGEGQIAKRRRDWPLPADIPDAPAGSIRPPEFLMIEAAHPR